MYNIYTTQKTTTKLTSDKKEPKKKLQHTSEEKQIGFEPEFNWDIKTDSKGENWFIAGKS